MSRWLARLALPVAVATGLFLAGSSAAWADSTVNINPGNVPTTAKAQTQQCSVQTGGGPFAGTDTWVFVLPGSHNDSGDFVSLTAKFDTNGDGTADQTRVIPTDGGGFLNGGPDVSKAFLSTPAGWKLVAASAVITGSASFFTLSHACAADGSTPTPTPTPTRTPPTTTTTTTTTATTPGGPGTSPGDDGSLPTTGVALTGVIVAGVALVAGGVALLIIRRRQDRAASGGGL